MSVLKALTRIVQAAAEADSPRVQVNRIVDGIQQEMAVDVCTLYLLNDCQELVMVASHGLAIEPIGRAVVPHGKGMVNEVVDSRRILNVVDPESHPAFYYIQGSGEEQFRSFCALPLIRGSDVIGVLAVQRRLEQLLSEEEIAFLVTLGAQLALVLANWQDWQSAEVDRPKSLPGVKGAGGIGLGKVHLCEEHDLFGVAEGVAQDVAAELGEWETLLARVQAEVKAEQACLDTALSDEVSAIFDAYLMLLADPTLAQGVGAEIQGGKNLPSALRKVIKRYADLFMAMEDPYLRARHEDIRHLGNRLYATWRLVDRQQDSLPEGPVVLVGGQVSVSDIASLPRERLAGVVCFHGSALSHTAVLCNALGVPAVLGIGEHKNFKEGDAVVVDGNTAQVLLNPDAELWREYNRLWVTQTELGHQLAALRDVPATTTDGERIELYANSGLTADIQPGLINGAEGLGLYRTEIPFMLSDTFPSEDAQVQLYSEVMQAYGTKPVYMRVLDVGSDKPLPYFPVIEDNPALGWRGIRFCLDNSALLITQLRAMLRAAADANNLHIILPMVSSIHELTRFRSLLGDVLEQLRHEGFTVTSPRVGIMVEVPAVISQLHKWRETIDFLSIGSNDLSQYILALDRNNPRVASLYDHLHPAVLEEVGRVCAAAETAQLPVSLCGEMASDPEAVVLLVGMGVKRLSMSAAQLPRIKWLIRAIDRRRAGKLYEAACRSADSGEIRAMTRAYLSELGFPGIEAK